MLQDNRTCYTGETGCFKRKWICFKWQKMNFFFELLKFEK